MPGKVLGLSAEQQKRLVSIVKEKAEAGRKGDTKKVKQLEAEQAKLPGGRFPVTGLGRSARAFVRRTGATQEEASAFQSRQTAAKSRAAVRSSERTARSLFKKRQGEEEALRDQQKQFLASRQRENTEAFIAERRSKLQSQGVDVTRLQRAQGRPNPKATATPRTEIITEEREGQIIQREVQVSGRDIQREQARQVAQAGLAAPQTVQPQRTQKRVQLRESLNLLESPRVSTRPAPQPIGSAAAILGVQTLPRPEQEQRVQQNVPVGPLQQETEPLRQRAPEQVLPTARTDPELFGLPEFLDQPLREAQRTTREFFAPITNIPADIESAITGEEKPRTQTAFDDLVETIVKAGTPAAKDVGAAIGVSPPPTPQERQEATAAFPGLIETAKKEPRRFGTTAAGEGFFLAATGGAFQLGKLGLQAVKLRGTTKALDELLGQLKPPKTRIEPTPPREVPGKKPDIAQREVEQLVGPKGLIQEQVRTKKLAPDLFLLESTDPRSAKTVLVEFAGREQGKPVLRFGVIEESDRLTTPQLFRLRSKAGEAQLGEFEKFGFKEVKPGLFEAPASARLEKLADTASVRRVARLRVFESKQITTKTAPELGRFFFGKSTPTGAKELSVQPVKDIELLQTKSFSTKGTTVTPQQLKAKDFPGQLERRPKVFKPKEDLLSFEVRQNIKEIDPFAEITRRASKTGRPIGTGRFGIGDKPRPVTKKAEIRKTVLDDLITDVKEPRQDVFGTLPFSAARGAGLVKGEPIVILDQRKPTQRGGAGEQDITESTSPELIPPETITEPTVGETEISTSEEIIPKTDEVTSITTLQGSSTSLIGDTDEIIEETIQEKPKQKPKQKQRVQPLNILAPQQITTPLPPPSRGRPFGFNFPTVGPPLGGSGGGFIRSGTGRGRKLFAVNPGISKTRVGVISEFGIEGTLIDPTFTGLKRQEEEFRKKSKRFFDEDDLSVNVAGIGQSRSIIQPRQKKRTVQRTQKRKAQKRKAQKRKAPKRKQNKGKKR